MWAATGVGKTNLLDAVYYLSFCRSAFSQTNQQALRHGQEWMALNGTYLTPLDDELFTHGFVQRWADRKTLLLPKVQGDSLTLHRYIDSRSLGQGAFGIMEPCTPQFTNCSAVDLVIVPGLAFDAEGNRLGRGRGYYDRLFAELLPPSVYKVGVCYPFQMVPQVPTEPTDITMDEVIARSA